MRIALYSGDDPRCNLLPDSELGAWLNSRQRLTYIPSSAEGAAPYFLKFKNYYSRRFGIKKFNYFPLDGGCSARSMNEALKSDVIYLSGGNTFAFLHLIRRQGLIRGLRDFCGNGGTLIGVSAGAIIMTPSICTAGIPSFAADSNDAGLRDLKSLGLVDFLFLPHVLDSARYRKELARFSGSSGLPLYACQDGGAILIEEQKVKFLGKIDCYFRGQRTHCFS